MPLLKTHGHLIQSEVFHGKMKEIKVDRKLWDLYCKEYNDPIPSSQEEFKAFDEKVLCYVVAKGSHRILVFLLLK